MYFMPRYHKIHDMFSTVNAVYRYALTLGIAITIVFIWFVADYAKNKRIINQYSQQIKLLKHVHQDSSINSDIDYEKLQIMQHRYDNYLSENKNSLAQIIDFLTTIAKKANVRIEQCMPYDEQKKEWYSVQPIDVRVIGSYAQIKKLFDLLRTYNYLVRCAKVDVSCVDDQLALACLFKFYHIDQELDG